ncbi:MAG: HNH endonuclease, partial [Solirubrobacteraceae bacterium]
PLRRHKNAVLRDREPVPAIARGKELIGRLLAGRCEICGQADKVRVHQIHKLSDLDQPGQPDQPEWVQIMTRRRRKTLVVCDACHDSIHRRPTASTTE